jgi:hypothetical protein
LRKIKTFPKWLQVAEEDGIDYVCGDILTVLLAADYIVE